MGWRDFVKPPRGQYPQHPQNPDSVDSVDSVPVGGLQELEESEPTLLEGLAHPDLAELTEEFARTGRIRIEPWPDADG